MFSVFRAAEVLAATDANVTKTRCDEQRFFKVGEGTVQTTTKKEGCSFGKTTSPEDPKRKALKLMKNPNQIRKNSRPATVVARPKPIGDLFPAPEKRAIIAGAKRMSLTVPRFIESAIREKIQRSPTGRC
jgi:hypothetical protein